MKLPKKLAKASLRTYQWDDWVYKNLLRNAISGSRFCYLSKMKLVKMPKYV
jgi:hypothetical protein